MKVVPQVFVGLLAVGSFHYTSAELEPALVAPTPPPNTWSRTYGGPVTEHGLYDLRLLPGGRLVAAGYTGSFGLGGHANWQLRLDLATGAVNTERVSNSALGGFSDGASIAADGGALFLGRDVLDIQTKHDAWIMRTDPAGNVLWTRGFTRPGTGRHFLFDAAELPDGSWIAVGATGLLDFPPQAAWIMRLSAAGVPIWQYEYGGGTVETVRCVTLTADGGFAVAGVTNSSGAGGDDLWVMKIDALGAVQWQRTFGGLDAEQAEDIVLLGDGGFAVVGSTNSLTASGHAPWILRLDNSGSLLWHRVVDSGVWGDFGGVARTSDGQIVAIGRVGEPGFPSNDLWCAKFDAATGAEIWQRAYEGILGDFGSDVLPISGSGLEPGLVVGGTWGSGFSGEAIWLSRTDRTGRLGCGIDRVTKFDMIRPGITIKNGLAVRAPGGAILEDPGVQEAPSSAVVTALCH